MNNSLPVETAMRGVTIGLLFAALALSIGESPLFPVANAETFPSNEVTRRTPEKNLAVQPHVLLIIADDLNDWIGCLHGHPQVVTPNLDRLARRGVLFTNAHCTAPICNPSRVSIWTGMRPSTSGVYGNGLGDVDYRKSPVFNGKLTMPRQFARHGYRTHGIGKLFHDPGQSAEAFDIFGGAGDYGPYPDEKLNYPLGWKQWDWGPFPDTDEITTDGKSAQWAIEQLRNSSAKPKFLAVGFYRPHVPMYVPQKWFDMYPCETVKQPATGVDDLDDLPVYGRSLTTNTPIEPSHDWMKENQKWSSAVQAYLASVSFLDAQVGLVLDALDQSSQGDNTIVVFCSDNGWHLGEKNRWAKGALWERATKVPLLIVPPRSWNTSGTQWATDAECTRPVGLIDLFPTLLDICGLPPRADLDGHSLVPLLQNPKSTWTHPLVTTFHLNNHAVRSERWRYIRYADGSEELYDHASDPDELLNLASDPRYVEIRREHFEQLPKINYPDLEAKNGTHLQIRFDDTEAESVQPALLAVTQDSSAESDLDLTLPKSLTDKPTAPISTVKTITVGGLLMLVLMASGCAVWIVTRSA